MTDNWDSYLCEVDLKPASILVDLGVVSEAPMRQYPCMGYVSIYLQSPDEHGFAAREEYDRLITIEDALEAVLSGPDQGVYVGRCATVGKHFLVFYTSCAKGFKENVAQVMQEFSGYVWEAGTETEENWETYLGFLFPGETDLLSIQNRRVCRQLEENGDDLSKIRHISHWLEFASHDAGLQFCEEAKTLDFSIEEEKLVSVPVFEKEREQRGNHLFYSVRLGRPDAPQAIDEVTFTLADLAFKYNGEYRGWGCKQQI